MVGKGYTSCHKDARGSGFLTSALMQLHVPSFTLEERVNSTHWIGGCVGSWATLDAVMEGKIIASAENQIMVAQPAI
jgi:hypothetical protein